jgi:hypothetical protein
MIVLLSRLQDAGFRGFRKFSSYIVFSIQYYVGLGKFIDVSQFEKVFVSFPLWDILFHFILSITQLEKIESMLVVRNDFL